MSKDQLTHLSEEQLSRFEDGELGERETRHLASCSDCSKRLEDLRAAIRAYVEYRDSIEGSPLPPPRRWLSLSELAEQHQVSRQRKILRWWPIPAVAAACVAVVLAVMYESAGRPSVRATELLNQSATVDLPEERSISVRLRGRTLIRPAVLRESEGTAEDPGLAEVRSVFVAAHYSWREPLSARSFQAWRDGLKQKRDSVSIVRGAGDVESFRVRTETPTGVLQSASLTLRRRDLRPTNASFDFKPVGNVEMGEVPAPTGGAAPPPHLERQREVIAEAPAGPGDTLRVLAALNKIGADVGEPIDVSLDARRGQVVVRSQGVTAEREQQIARTLGHLPHVVLELSPDASEGIGPTSEPAEKYSTAVSTLLRTELESKFGSPIALQEATDRVLDHSAAMLAQAHALEILAVTFSAETEEHLIAADRALLQSLRQDHILKLERLLTQIRTDLKPLLSALPQKSDLGETHDWQHEAHVLMADVQETDKLLNRLLAGSYSLSSGEEMLRLLPERLQQLDSAVRFQRNAGR
jgi:hypothetical protein